MSRKNGINQGSFQKIARAMTRNYGVDVRPSSVNCATDGKTIRYPFNADHLSNATKKTLHGLLDHEICHVMEEEEAKKDKNKTSPMSLLEGIDKGNRKEKMALNVFEDIRIEMKYSEIFKGMGENIRNYNINTAKTYVEKFSDKNYAKKANFWHTLGCGIIFKSRNYNTEWLPDMYKPYMDALQDEINDCKYMKCVEDAHSLAKRMISKVHDTSSELEDELNDRIDFGDMGDDTSDDSGNGNEDSCENGENNYGRKNIYKDDKSKKNNNDKGKKSKPSGSNYVKSCFKKGSKFEGITDDDIKRILGKLKKDIDCDVDDISDDIKRSIHNESLKDAIENKRYIPNPNVLEHDKWIVPELASEDHEKEWYSREREVVASQIRGLRGKLLSIIRTKAVSTMLGGYRSGRLDRGKMAQITAGNVNVFKREVEGETLDTAISIVVDLSGSMGSAEDHYSKARYAKLMVIALSETFDVLNIPFEVIGFHNDWSKHYEIVEGTQRGEALEFFKFKCFNEKYSKCKFRMNHITGMGNNTDGEAVMSVAIRLAYRKESRKILLVVSDGQPAGGLVEHTVLYSHLKEVIKTITSSGIEVAGIGVLTDSVNQFYNENTGAKHIVINKLDKLAVDVYKLMKGMLLMKYRKN